MLASEPHFGKKAAIVSVFSILPLQAKQRAARKIMSMENDKEQVIDSYLTDEQQN